jgi:excisionase family DNA binding protein
LFTFSEVSKKLRVNTNTVYGLIRNGHISTLKLGSLKIISTELERFLNYANGKDFTDLYNIKDLEFNKK